MSYGYGNGYGGGYGGPPQGPPQGFGGGYDNYGPPQGPPPGRHGGGGGGFPGSGGLTYGGSSAQPPPGPPGGYGAPPGNYGPPGGNYGAPPGPPPANYGNRPQSGGGYQQGGGMAPPSRPQQFVPGGQTYQYSDCTGRRKALLIGINYFGSKNELKGCINDARAMSSFLKDRYNYREEDMVILTDDQRDPRSQPTKDNILRGMQWLVSGANTNDTLFFHYSGHGGQTEDLDGDEDDGYDEVIYPVDFQRAGHIVDDQIHDIMVRPLYQGVRLTALFDSCHSGTVLDLPYIYSTKGVIKEPNLLKDAGQGAMSALQEYAQGDMGGLFKTVSGFVKKAATGRAAEEKTRMDKTSPADAILISGCKDDQTSADAQNAGLNTGAMSYAFITVMTRNPNQSYISLLNEMRQVMSERYTQRPQLSSSHPIDTNLKFIM